MMELFLSNTRLAFRHWVVYVCFGFTLLSGWWSDEAGRKGVSCVNECLCVDFGGTGPVGKCPSPSLVAWQHACRGRSERGHRRAFGELVSRMSVVEPLLQGQGKLEECSISRFSWAADAGVCQTRRHQLLELLRQASDVACIGEMGWLALAGA